MSLISPILSDPVLVALLTVAVLATILYQRTLGWREYRRLHQVKTRIAPLLSRLWLTTARVEYRNKSPEYLGTLPQPPHRVFRTLVGAGGSPHLINAVKYRKHGGDGREYMVFSVVFNVGSQEQVECYGFPSGSGGVDLYSHTETSILNVDGHLTDDGVPGDPRYIVRDALGEAPK